MKKLLFACMLGGVLLLAGCKDSAIKNAQDLIANGDYKAAVEVLEKYSGDETAVPILNEARLKLAIADAQAAIDAKDYQTAVSLLEQFKDNSEASELCVSAKKMLLEGRWQNFGGETLRGAYVNITFEGNVGKAVLEHSVENYYGYDSGDILWRSINVSAGETLSMNVLERDIDYSSEYTEASAVLNFKENTIEFSDNFLGKWKKLTSEETLAALMDSPALTKTYNGTVIQKNPTALAEFGKRKSQYSGNVFSDASFEGGKYPFVYLYYRNEIDSYPYEGIVLDGGSLSDNIYCGMTKAQVLSLEDRGTITQLFPSDVDPHGYSAYYQCSINGETENLRLTFVFDNDELCVTDIQFFSPYLDDLTNTEYVEWQVKKRQEEEQKRQQQEAAKDIAYSTDGLLYYFGEAKEYIYSSNGQVAVCEPSMWTNLYLGNICCIENYSVLDNALILYAQGYLRKTNRSVTYRGVTYPVYRAVKVIQ